MEFPVIDVEPIEPLLKKERRILAAYLLGSAAKGTLRPDSDIDIALMFVPGKIMSGVERGELAAELSLLLHREVDLGVISSRNLVYARESILTGRRIFSRNDTVADLYAATLLGLYAQFHYERRGILHGYLAR
ncbi:MAG TPA: nucleotidyltransferase domain-containing protein [bacterium]|nr:nucleotidyltransferase domain-containing protein [bacterium]